MDSRMPRPASPWTGKLKSPLSTDAHQRLMEVGLLGLTDGVIAAVVDQEDLNGKMVG